MKKALILMTRIPIPGKTKTRLMTILSANECAEIHMAFLKDLFILLEKVKDSVDVYLTYTPENSLNIIEDIIPSFIETFPQKGEDLGEKMKNAIEDILNKGYDCVELMGSDIPQVTHNDILKSFQDLEEKDIVLGPTLDGGYYLVGMKKMHDEIFDDSLKWGNKTVLEGTMDILNSKGLSLSLINKHRDIDTKEDLIDFKYKFERGKFHECPPLNTINYINRIWSWSDELNRRVKG